MRITVTAAAGGEIIENEYTGSYDYDGENAVIRYEDTAEGSAGGTVTLTCRPGRLDIARRGGLGARMALIPGESTRGAYITPHGELAMTVTTGELRVELTDRGGTVEAVYTLGFTHGSQENTLKIILGQ